MSPVTNWDQRGITCTATIVGLWQYISLLIDFELIVLIQDWLPLKARDLSLPYYLWRVG